MGKSVNTVCKWITSVGFFVNKRTNNKLLFTHWANGKWIKENRLGFHCPFEIAAYKYLYICIYIQYLYIQYVLPFQYFNIRKTKLTENGNFRLFAANGKRKGKLLFVFCKQKYKSVFLGQQTINGYQHLQFQQTCQSMRTPYHLFFKKEIWPRKAISHPPPHDISFSFLLY